MIIHVRLCAYIVVGGFLHICSAIFKHVDDGIRIDGQISIWLSRAQGEMFMTKKWHKTMQNPWLFQMFPLLRATDMLSWLYDKPQKGFSSNLDPTISSKFHFSIHIESHRDMYTYHTHYHYTNMCVIYRPSSPLPWSSSNMARFQVGWGRDASCESISCWLRKWWTCRLAYSQGDEWCNVIIQCVRVILIQE